MRIQLDFGDDPPVPEGWTPLEAVAIVKYIDEEGVVRLHETATAGLSTWEGLGMLIWAADSARRDLQEAIEE